MDDFITLFSLVGRAARVLAEHRLADLGLHVGQQFVLYCLWEQDGLTPSEIARRVRVETPTTTRAIQRMEQAGLVTRELDRDDGRRVRVFLTERGRALQDVVPAAMTRMENELLRDFSATERAEFIRMLQILYRTVEELPQR